MNLPVQGLNANIETAMSEASPRRPLWRGPGLRWVPLVSSPALASEGPRAKIAVGASRALTPVSKPAYPNGLSRPWQGMSLDGVT